MSNSTSVWSKIDTRVWLTMGIAVLLSLLLLAFKAATYEDCETFKITFVTHDGKPDGTAGKEISFSVNSNEAIWDFGDGTEPAKGNKIKHTYFAVGTFTVTVKLPSNCTQFTNITIRRQELPSSAELKDFHGPIFGDTVIPAGVPLTLTSTQLAQSYSWTVQGQDQFGEKIDRNVSFIFTEPGSYIVQLVLDGKKEKTFLRNITVSAPLVDDVLSDPLLNAPSPVVAPTPLPTVAPKQESEEEATPEKSFTNITDAEMKLLLADLVDGKKQAADFEKYLCNGVNTKVVANGKATVFAELVGKLQDKKGIMGIGGKRKIKNVKQTFDAANGNCTLVLNVEYK